MQNIVKKISIAAGAAALAGLSGVSLAQTAPTAGWFGGLSVDGTRQHVGGGNIGQALANQGITSSSNSFDDTDTTYGLSLGYRFNRNFALEGGYSDLGKYNFSSTATAPAADTVNGAWKAHAWSISGLGFVPFNNQWSAFGRLGLTRTAADLSPSSQTGALATTSTSQDRNGIVYGGGVNYDINRNWFGRAEVDRFTRVGDSNTGNGNVDVLSVGLGFKF